jgi:hypothetical protein
MKSGGSSRRPIRAVNACLVSLRPKDTTARDLETRNIESLQETTKEVVGIHVLQTHSLFACGIPRRLLLPVSLAKPTSAPLQF